MGLGVAVEALTLSSEATAAMGLGMLYLSQSSKSLPPTHVNKKSPRNVVSGRVKYMKFNRYSVTECISSKHETYIKLILE